MLMHGPDSQCCFSGGGFGDRDGGCHVINMKTLTMDHSGYHILESGILPAHYTDFFLYFEK